MLGRAAASLVICALCVGLGSAARAHEIPRGLRVAVEGERIVVTTNRGFVVSADGGDTFHLHCGAAAGLGSSDDPPFRLMPGAGLVFASFQGVQWSSADFCNFDGSETLDVSTPALSAVPDTDAGVLAGTNGAPDVQRLYRSDDGGRTFSPLAALDAGDYFADGIAVSPDDPLRIYATALTVPDTAGDPLGLAVARSGDGGATLALAMLTAEDTQDRHAVLGVLPGDPDAVFVRVDGLPEFGRADTILRSTDGGLSFTAVLEAPELRAFVAAPDGERVWAGGEEGLWRSDDGGLSFARLFDDRIVSCLGYHGGALWACRDGVGALAVPGLDRSEDGGDSWTELMRFDDVVEPPDCPLGTPVAELCESAWQDWERELLGPPPDAGTGGGMVLVDAGATLDAGGDAGTPPDAGQGSGSSGGCGCRLSPVAPSRGGLPLLVGLFGLALFVRRRARR